MPENLNGQRPAPVAVAVPTAKAVAETTLERPHPSRLLSVLNDLRDRNTPDYRDFFGRLVPDIGERGVQVPIIAYREGDSIRVIDGETRRLAALMAGVESVPVLVHPQKPSEAELALAKLQANAMRLDMNDLEYAEVYQRLMQLHGWGQAELARHIHASPSTINKRLQISKNLAADLKAKVASGELAPRAAYQLARLQDPAIQMELGEKLLKGLLKVESLEEAVIRILNGGKPKRKEAVVKARTPKGVQVVLLPLGLDVLVAELTAVIEAIRKAQKHSLPMSAIPQLLKGA